MTGFQKKGFGVRQVMKITVLALLAIIVAPLQKAASQELADSDGPFNMERRRDRYKKDFAYFINPIAGKVPGLGSVADSDDDPQKKMRSSYGAGFRVLYSGVTIRLDYAFGDEGSEMQLFLDYPWSMFSIDNTA